MSLCSQKMLFFKSPRNTEMSIMVCCCSIPSTSLRINMKHYIATTILYFRFFYINIFSHFWQSIFPNNVLPPQKKREIKSSRIFSIGGEHSFNVRLSAHWLQCTDYGFKSHSFTEYLQYDRHSVKHLKSTFSSHPHNCQVQSVPTPELRKLNLRKYNEMIHLYSEQ